MMNEKEKNIYRLLKGTKQKIADLLVFENARDLNTDDFIALYWSRFTGDKVGIETIRRTRQLLQSPGGFNFYPRTHEVTSWKKPVKEFAQTAHPLQEELKL